MTEVFQILTKTSYSVSRKVVGNAQGIACNFVGSTIVPPLSISTSVDSRLPFHYVAVRVENTQSYVTAGRVSGCVDIQAFDESGKPMCDGLRLAEFTESVPMAATANSGCPIVAEIPHLFTPNFSYICNAGFIGRKNQSYQSDSTPFVCCGVRQNNQSPDNFGLKSFYPSWILLTGKIKTITATAIGSNISVAGSGSDSNYRFIVLYVHSTSWPVLI
jgi:hypothetical protein